MRKVFTSILASLMLLVYNNASAFSLKDLVTDENVGNVVSSVATAVTGGIPASTSSLAGTWSYDSSAVKLESDKTLTEAAGSIVTSQAESKLDNIFSKVGIAPGLFSFTFGSDMTFSCSTKGKSLKGTYSVDSNDQITLTFKAIGTVKLGSIKTITEITGSKLSLLFSADKLLDIISSLSSSSNNSTLQGASSMLSKYDGMLLGFDLSK